MPPADDENVKTGASTATTAMQMILENTLRVPANLGEASVASGSPEVDFIESEGEKEDEMVDALEDLILEAYNNMQIDGEYIFLPDKVAEKLHRVAEQLKQSEEEQQKESNTNAEQDSNSGDAAARMADEEKMTMLQEILTDQPEPEQKKEQEKAQVKEQEKSSVHDERGTTSEDNEARQRKMHLLQAKATELQDEQQKQRISRAMSAENIFMELVSVPELDESDSSKPPLPSSPPPLSRSHSGANTSRTRIQTPTQSRRCFPSPSPMSLSSPYSAKPGYTRKSPVSRTSPVPKTSPASRTPDQSDDSKRKSKLLNYGTRREAALRQKEDKMKREVLVRETARKQREDSKRQLEEMHQREIEEKRERVRRIREERLLRKLTGAKGTKKEG